MPSTNRWLESERSIEKFAGFLFGLLVLLSAAACSGGAPQGGTTSTVKPSQAETGHELASWAGTYEYTDSGARTTGGEAIVVVYRLVIPNEPRSEATLSIEGFQSDQKLKCAISGDSHLISVRFLSYANGEIKNQFGVSEYQPDAVLFTLSRAGEGPGQELITDWQALKPDQARAQSGKYFEKTIDGRANHQ